VRTGVFPGRARASRVKGCVQTPELLRALLGLLARGCPAGRTGGGCVADPPGGFGRGDGAGHGQGGLPARPGGPAASDLPLQLDHGKLRPAGRCRPAPPVVQDPPHPTRWRSPDGRLGPRTLVPDPAAVPARRGPRRTRRCVSARLARLRPGNRGGATVARASSGTLEDVKVGVRGKLAALWSRRCCCSPTATASDCSAPGSSREVMAGEARGWRSARASWSRPGCRSRWPAGWWSAPWSQPDPGPLDQPRPGRPGGGLHRGLGGRGDLGVLLVAEQHRECPVAADRLVRLDLVQAGGNTTLKAANLLVGSPLAAEPPGQAEGRGSRQHRRGNGRR
jgi:hypothetical protein